MVSGLMALPGEVSRMIMVPVRVPRVVGVKVTAFALGSNETVPFVGLLTPVIRNADGKSLSAISNEMKDLAARAKEKKLKPAEYQGGSSAISNLGMYGVREFSAIINPPHATILAVGASQRRPVEAEDGSVKFVSQMTATLSCDHRVVDGALGAELLAAFKALIESPVRMLV